MRDQAKVISLSFCLIVILLTSAAILRTGGHHVLPGAPRREPAPANLALVDTITTERVSGVLAADIMRLYTYESDEPWQTGEAANTLLTGPAIAEYHQSLQSLAAQPGTVLTTGVLESAVADLTPQQATVLLVINQQTTTPGSRPATKTATLALTAIPAGGTWKISQIQQNPTTVRPTGFPPDATDDPEQRTAKNRDEALSAAEHAAEVLNTMDYPTAPAHLAAWRAVSTGDLLNAINEKQTEILDQVTTARTQETATADAAAVADLTETHAYVLVLLTRKTPANGPTPTPVFLSMTKTNGTWLTSALQSIPG